MSVILQAFVFGLTVGFVLQVVFAVADRVRRKKGTRSRMYPYT